MTFGTDGQDIVVYIKVDILFVKAGEIGLKLVMIALIFDIGLEFIKRGVIEESERICKKAVFKLVYFTERVVKGIIFS